MKKSLFSRLSITTALAGLLVCTPPAWADNTSQNNANSQNNVITQNSSTSQDSATSQKQKTKKKKAASKKKSADQQKLMAKLNAASSQAILECYNKVKDSNKQIDVTKLQTRAQSGSSDAQALLGLLLLSGMSVPLDHVLAVDYLHQSVLNNNPMGMFLLGLCYINGNGVREDIREGVNLIRRSAELGYIDAGYYLYDFRNDFRDYYRDDIRDDYRDYYRDEIRDDIRDDIRDEHRDEIRDEIRDELVDSHIEEHIEEHIDEHFDEHFEEPHYEGGGEEVETLFF